MIKSAHADISLIMGLGNPGKNYKDTYHNAGKLFIERLEIDPSWKKSKFFIYKSLEKNPVKTAIPLTFMNESGGAVKEAIRQFKIKPENLLIAHDDSDIDIGKYKISFDRGSAGHRGIQSIINTLGTTKFWRLRIGIRPTLNPLRAVSRRPAGKPSRNFSSRMRAGDFVLKRITKENKEILENAFQNASKEILENI